MFDLRWYRQNGPLSTRQWGDWSQLTHHYCIRYTYLLHLVARWKPIGQTSCSHRNARFFIFVCFSLQQCHSVEYSSKQTRGRGTPADAHTYTTLTDFYAKVQLFRRLPYHGSLLVRLKTNITLIMSTTLYTQQPSIIILGSTTNHAHA